MSSQRLRGAFAFGHFVFDLQAQSLHRDGQAIELGSRALDVLAMLVEANGDLVTKNTLMDQVWPGLAVEENNLQVQVSALRRVLGDERGFIRPLPGAATSSLARSCLHPGPRRNPSRTDQRSPIGSDFRSQCCRSSISVMM